MMMSLLMFHLVVPMVHYYYCHCSYEMVWIDAIVATVIQHNCMLVVVDCMVVPNGFQVWYEDMHRVVLTQLLTVLTVLVDYTAAVRQLLHCCHHHHQQQKQA